MWVLLPKIQWCDRIQQIKQRLKETCMEKTQFRKYEDSLKKSLSFYSPQLRNRRVLNPLVLITELGHHRRDPRSQACFVILASARGLEKNYNLEQPSQCVSWSTSWFLASGSLKFHLSHLSTSTLPDNLVLRGQGIRPHSVCWDISQFLLTEKQGFQITSFWNGQWCSCSTRLWNRTVKMQPLAALPVRTQAWNHYQGRL